MLFSDVTWAVVEVVGVVAVIVKQVENMAFSVEMEVLESLE